MEAYQRFLKPELAALAEKHPEKTPRDRLKMARETYEAQNVLPL